jgi:hypothetical protein
MSNLFPPAFPAEALQSPSLRLVQITGDGLCDTYRANRDYALMVPVTSYCGEGIYAVSNPFGYDFFRVESTLDGTRRLRLFRENPHYSDQFMTLDDFEAKVLGIVAADVRIRNDRLIADAVEHTKGGRA